MIWREVCLVLLSLSGFGEFLLLGYLFGIGFAWRLCSRWQDSANEVSFETIGLEDGFAWDDGSGYRVGNDRACIIG